MTMYKQAIAPVLAIVATVGIFSIPNAAMAQAEKSSVSVSYADLDLTTPDGQQKLDRRIDRAARQVCAMDEVTTGTLIRSQASNVCYRLALRDVRSHVAAAASNSRSGS
jgi:UrcA family protein